MVARSIAWTLIMYFAATCATRAETFGADLRPRHKVGAEWRYVWSVKSVESTTGKNTPRPGTERRGAFNFDLLVRIIEANDAEAVATVKFERVRLEVQTPDGPTTFDSSAPAAEDAKSMLAPLARPMVGVDLTLRLDRLGNITKVTGGDVVLEGKGPAATFARRFIHEGAVRRRLGPIFSTGHTGGAVEPGATWTSSSEDPVQSLVLTIARTHTLEAADDKTARITSRGQPKVGGTPPEGTKVSIPQSEFTSQATWDLTHGILLQRSATDSFSWIVSGDDPHGIEITLTSRNEESLTRKD